MKIGIKQDNKELYKSIMVMAAPIILQSLIQHFQVLIDRAWLGNLKVEYLSALGNAMVPYFTTTSFLFSASLGITITIAHKIGARNYEAARSYAESSFLFTSFFSIAVFLIWAIFADPIFRFMGTSGEILAYSATYIRILVVTLIFFGIDLTASAVFQGIGYTLPIMVTGLIKNLLNLVLDWILIFGKFGVPAMGLEGAAWATTFSNITGTLILFIILLNSNKIPFKVRLIAVFKSKWLLYKDVFKMGYKTGLEGLLWNLGQLVCIRLLNTIDPMAAGIYSVVYGIQLIGLFMYLGVARATTTMVGQKWGANDKEGGVHVGMLCLKVSLLICVFISLLCLFIPGPILRIFTSDMPTITKGIPLIYFTAFIVYFQALNMITGAAIRGTGNVQWMVATQIFGTLFIISIAAFCIFVLKLGVMGMFVAMLIDEVVRGFINLYRFWTDKNPFAFLIKKRPIEGNV